MPYIKLSDEAIFALEKYNWPGNIRQLKNVVEQISVIESDRDISLQKMKSYLPEEVISGVPSIIGTEGSEGKDAFSDRELIYKFLFDMKRDMNELKKLVIELLKIGRASCRERV